MNVKGIFKKNPCVIWLEKPYAIGGDVVISETPPKLGRTISECSNEDYKKLYELGYTRFFDLETKSKVNKKVKDESERNNEGVRLEDDTTITTNEG